MRESDAEAMEDRLAPEGGEDLSLRHRLERLLRLNLDLRLRDLRAAMGRRTGARSLGSSRRSLRVLRPPEKPAVNLLTQGS